MSGFYRETQAKLQAQGYFLNYSESNQAEGQSVHLGFLGIEHVFPAVELKAALAQESVIKVNHDLDQLI